MGRRVNPDYRYLPALGPEQARASQPDAHVWLSASAGAGKTQVLAARVLRLLLNGVPPETILCLTFTKAGASEMANRIHGDLARWVMAEERDLVCDLEALGERATREACERARTLFAALLDARGGGLRIQTIHSFCQSLLSAFPLEAGLPPGFRLAEDRDMARLEASVFAQMMAEADEAIRARAATLGMELGEASARAFLSACGSHADVLAGISELTDMRRFMHRALYGGETDDIAAVAFAMLQDPLPPSLAAFAGACESWGTATGSKSAIPIRTWIALPHEQRIEGFADVEKAWLTADRKPRAMGKKGPALEAAELAIRLHEWSEPIHGLIQLAKQADRQAEALMLGRAFAVRWRDAKVSAGLVDYGDLIRRAAALLATPGMGEWVRYKLDQATDHILIDEAQDTNADQWAIIKALTDEYFAGAGSVGNRTRTIFTVGDYKQAIFGFQGTDPENFREAHDWFAKRAAAAEQELDDVSLSLSWRSSQPVLDLTDAVIDALGAEAFGLDGAVALHESARGGPGSVMLVPPITTEEAELVSSEDEEEWIGEAERLLARKIADQVWHWWKVEPLWLARQGRLFTPGDTMVLLRKRGELARLIVARLHERGIPVAGLDRLRLGAPLAVQDLMACARFAMQPEDDLNLAGLLVSPLIGLTQDQLYQAAKGRKGALWPHLPEDLRAQLMPVLNAADMASPHQFFEMILSGPMQGRARLLARLGEEARDPVNELLNAALAYEAQHPPSLQLFLDWFDKGDSDIKRDAEGAGGAVRVMTAHGAKGLQAPLVILADATGSPKAAKSPTTLMLPLPEGDIPLINPRKAERTLALKELADRRDERELREHRRLLYVALTRAEERLIVAGALKKPNLPEDSWHASVALGMETLGADLISHPVWGEGVRVAGIESPPVEMLPSETPPIEVALPDWLRVPPAPEAAPARPLAPSALGADDDAHPPATAAMLAAAERGRLIHALFERLPDVQVDRRAAAAMRWLEGSAGVSDNGLREEVTRTVLAILDDPALAGWFAPGGLAEAPLAGVVDGFVVAGTADRLVVSDDAVLVIDFKTGRRVPATPDKAPRAHLRQMAAYAVLLAQAFPGKRVEAALLYTEGPVAHVLPPEVLERHKPDLGWVQEVLPA